MAGWGSVLRELVLVPGSGGVFDVDVDGERVFSKHDLGGRCYPEPDEVLSRIRERIGDKIL